MKLFIIQPLIASYRKDSFNELSKYFDNVIIFVKLNISNSFKSNIEGDFYKVYTNVFGKREKLYYEAGIATPLVYILMFATFTKLNKRIDI